MTERLSLIAWLTSLALVTTIIAAASVSVILDVTGVAF